MVISQISEGLGNQMFQYAAGRRLAHHLGTTLKLDDYHYRLHPFRSFQLDRFQISSSLATDAEIRHLCPLEGFARTIRARLPAKVRGATLRLLEHFGLGSPYHARLHSYNNEAPERPLLIGKVASERHFHFDPGVLQCPDDVCLVGYWQDERYFREIRDILLSELTLKSPPTGETRAMLEKIQRSVSVSLHVRRGDKTNSSSYHCTSLEYCLASMAEMRSRLSSPTFFVFSDDWDWVRQQLPSSSSVIHVDHNTAEDVSEDFRLMKSCQHHIIASSSLSWWAAWLGAGDQSLVVSPPADQWLNFSNHYTANVLPSKWIQLDASSLLPTQ